MKNKNDLVLFSGNANRQLAEKIAEHLGVQIGKALVGQFPDGEVHIKIDENVRGKDVFLVQPTNSPAQNILELLIFLDALRRASPRRITAVIPYFGYQRQDRKDQPRVPISAKLMANLITTAGANRVLTMDLHSPQIQGFFDIPLDHLYAAPVLTNYYKEKFKGLKDTLTVVAPDVGSVKMNRAYSKILKGKLAIIDKRRVGDKKVEFVALIGEIYGKTALIIDDLVQSGSTLIQAAEAIKRKVNDCKVYACCTHATFSIVPESIINSNIDELVVTDTIYHPELEKQTKVKVLSVSKLLADAIRNIYEEKSISKLFIDMKEII